MKIIGIIAEYNPFHNGHAYQISEIRKRTGADYIVVAMSGDFVQRGTPAIIDKYARTRMALSCGADLVIELPTLWATASAEFFAMAGVTLFDKMGCVDGICFGAETDNLPLLKMIADILIEEPETYRNALNSYLKNGISFPIARAKALCKYLTIHHTDTHIIQNGLGNEESINSLSTYDSSMLSAIMNEPNNILAIEYLKALKRRGSKMEPHLLKREGAGYHDTVIASADTAIHDIASNSLNSYNSLGNASDITAANPPTASATAIRNILTNSISKDILALRSAMPEPSFLILTEYLSTTPSICENDFSSILYYLLLRETKDSLANIADCNQDIANRISKNRFCFSSFSDFCMQNKSRDITYTRMSRILLHLILNITNKDYLRGAQADYIPYLRILGFRRSSSTLLKNLKQQSTVPVISKLANASSSLPSNTLWMLEKDIFSADLYEQTVTQKICYSSFYNQKKTISRSEYTREIILV